MNESKYSRNIHHIYLPNADTIKDIARVKERLKFNFQVELDWIYVDGHKEKSLP